MFLLGGRRLKELSNWLKKHTIIQYVPIYELFLSLHVLSNPEHHLKRLSWAEETLSNLSSALIEELNYIKLITNDFLNLMDIIQPYDEKSHLSVEAGLEKVSVASTEFFVNNLIGYEVDTQKLNMWLAGQYDEEFRQLKPEIRELIKKPEAAKKRVLDFTYEYINYFQNEQRKIEPWLIRTVHNSQLLLDKNPMSFLNDIHPRFFIKSDCLEFHKAKTYQFYYKDLKKIYVQPSTFVDPHLLLGIQSGSISIGLNVAIPNNYTKSNVPMDLIRTMKALGDQTRLAILKNLLEHPYCIQQLAEIHQISEPAVKKHLKVLDEAELIWNERKGYYVFYKAIPEKLEMLTVDIHQFIDMEIFLKRE